ncbi:GDSL esterase/lipase At4g01130 [Selaginella moellendorffii]|uniref:GDSL esterase/lipase At4g01130 n=1 Tax=Selaginella moellendorffii TaxID=88036 RepID=UPI000D1CD208|nr:GDSL esterase/lipase At4g01130 [Selaginella moellendorffii]|eukprot:XP_024525595.1 GDSL esterase/lipase At4g01130 [Selaginella moellendorffii]
MAAFPSLVLVPANVPSLLLLLLLLTNSLINSNAAATLTCPVGIFSFGDSLADTGNYAAAFPDPPAPSTSSSSSSAIQVLSPQSSRVHNFFNYLDIRAAYDGAKLDMEFESSKAATKLPFRASNGRLVIDFIAQAFRAPFLAPYFQNVLPDYTNGVNFAFSSSTARNTSISVPFYLYRQVNHYIYLKGNIYNARGGASLPPFSIFSTALHWISIGINDFYQNYMVNNLSVSDVKNKVVPDAVHAVSEAVQRLYGFGARTFMVMNIPAVGCLPAFLSKFGTANPGDYDSLGCLKNHNDAAKAYATQLRVALSNLRLTLPQAFIMYGDYYQVHLDAVTNPTQYGLHPNGTLTACCGGGGKYNVPVSPCISSTPVCEDPQAYISWDGLHFCESFNRAVALTFLHGDYVEPWPNSNLTAACSLDFSKFYS